MTPSRHHAVLMLIVVAALLTAGCERAVFGFINRDTAPPGESVVYSAAKDLSLDLYRPRNVAADAKAPVVVFFYGGSWQRGSRGQYGFVGDRLARNGVLAIVADYRTWPRAKFPGFMEDAAQAVAWARANAARHGGDPRRVFIAGHSAGAQIAALLGTDARYLQDAGMPIGEVAGVIGLSGPYDFVVGKRYAPIFGPPELYPLAQAINFVDGDEPPFLLVHGDDDKVVEVRDSIELDAKLRAHGGESTLLLLPGAGHFAPAAALYDPERSPQVLPAILGFVRAPPAR